MLMTWTNEQISLLIETYERYPCLYFVKHKDYHNKHLRSLALTEVAKELQTLRPTCTEQEVQKKFLGLRTTYAVNYLQTFFAHHTIFLLVYQPSLWYFNKMAFLNDHLITRLSRSSHVLPECAELELSPDNLELESELSENPNLDISQCGVGDCSYFDVNVDGVLTPSSDNERPLSIDTPSSETTRSYSPTGRMDTLRSKFHETGTRVVHTPSKRLKKRDSSEINALKDISDGLGRVAGAFQVRHQPSIATKSAEDIMGEFEAAQLKKIQSDDVKEDVQFEIHKILWDALRK
ncbi:hypothetical protein ABEB36_012867 [Hypothenemus hampei]|uniref:MADF domain-containing protein n=1 Tax=Hypothenemus hampei TaxID=57062 RepID=A0ABD1E848_HYPHA